MAGLAGPHGLAPLLGTRVGAGELACADAAVAAKLARARAECLARNLLAEHVTRSFLDELPAYVLLKGAALLRSIYRDPGARPMNDLDVLVPRAAFASAIAAGERRGAKIFWPFARPLTRRCYHEIDLLFEGRVAVDLPGLSAWPLFRDARDLFARDRPVPAPVDLFVTVAMHAAQDGFAVPARAIVDGLLLRERVTPADALARARDFAAAPATARGCASSTRSTAGSRCPSVRSRRRARASSSRAPPGPRVSRVRRGARVAARRRLARHGAARHGAVSLPTCSFSNLY